MATYSFVTIAALNLTLAGTPQVIVGTATFVTRVWFQADAANTGTISIFENGNVAADGIVLDPGQIFELSIYQDSQDIDKLDLNTLRFDGATTGNDLRVSYVTT